MNIPDIFFFFSSCFREHSFFLKILEIFFFSFEDFRDFFFFLVYFAKLGLTLFFILFITCGNNPMSLLII